MKNIFLTAALMMMGAMSADAQWYHEPTPNDTLQSVRRLADGSAVFSIYAPQLNALAEGFNKGVKQLVFTMGGPEDIAYNNCKAMLKLFDDAGIKYEYSEAPGGHTWHTWRNNLLELAQRIF